MEFHSAREAVLYTTLKQVLQNHLVTHRLGYHETLAACVPVLGYVLSILSESREEAPGLVETTVAELKQRTQARLRRALRPLPSFQDYASYPVVCNYLIPASFLGLLSPADLALSYKPLQRVEEAWRTRKSGRRVRSVYHWAVHVLGLWLARVIAQACGNTGRNIRADVEQRKLAPFLRPHGEVWPVTAPAPEASPH